ncbi:MAG TPA: hypothetical protein VF355_05645 [Anaerolineaceae bacterium]
MHLQPEGPMTNQTTFEGYVVRAWTHGPDRFLRLANHRPANQGGPIPQSNMVYSDYTTVRLDSSIEFDAKKCRPGMRVIVRGRIEGRDIPETLGEILMHCNLNMHLPTNIANVVVTRPITQIFAVTLDIKQWHPGLRFYRRDYGGQRARDHRLIPAQASSAVVKAPAVALNTASVPEPGQDLAEFIAEPKPVKKAKAVKKTVQAQPDETPKCKTK